MSFTVDDFQDLLRLLDQHPEWRAELRRQILTDELLELPAVVRELADRVGALTERMDALTERMDALTDRMAALAEAQERTQEQLATLSLAQVHTEQRLDGLTQQISVLAGHAGRIAGDTFEWRYERHFPAYLSDVVRRPRLIEPTRLAEMLDDAVDEGRLTLAERNNAIHADLVINGRRAEDASQAYFVVEVSIGIGLGDVQRALERAQILAKFGQPAVPVVAGQWINPEATDMARATDVRIALGGPTTYPGLAEQLLA